MLGQSDLIIKKDCYLIGVRRFKKRKSLHFRLINSMNGCIYTIEWKDSSSLWKDAYQFYQFLESDNGKSIRVANSGSRLIFFQQYTVDLQRQNSHSKTEKDLPIKNCINLEERKQFIYEAGIANNLLTHKQTFVNSYPYGYIGLIYGLDEQLVEKDRQLADGSFQTFVQRQSKQYHTIGTGFIISPRLVLTCAHNVYKKSKNQHLSFLRQNLKFKLKKQEFNIIDIKIPKQYIESEDENFYQKYDYSLLLLESYQLQFYGLTLCYDYLQRSKGMIYGFPEHQNNSDEKRQNNSQINGLKMAGAADYIGWKENGLIYYDIKTEHGQSGSPVMVMLYSNDKKRRLMVIGIHICYSKELHRNVAVHLNQEIISQILRWQDQLSDILSQIKIEAFSAEYLNKFKEQKIRNEEIKYNKKRPTFKGKSNELRMVKFLQNLFIGMQLIQSQNYSKAIKLLHQAFQPFRQNDFQQRVNILFLLSIAHRKKQKSFDQKMAAKIYLKQIQKGEPLKFYEENRLFRKKKRQNRLNVKRMERNIKAFGSYEIAQKFINQALFIISVQNQKKENQLSNKVQQLSRIKQQGQTEYSCLKKQQIHPIIIYLQTQIQVLQDQKFRIDIKHIIIMLEKSNIYFSCKDLNAAQKILRQLEVKIKSIVQTKSKERQKLYKYLLASVYIKLGLIYDKQDGSCLNNEQNLVVSVKKQQANLCFESAYALQLQLNKLGYNIKAKNLKKLLSNFALQIGQISSSNLENELLNLFMLVLTSLQTFQQLRGTYIKIQIRQKFLQILLFYELLKQIQQFFLEKDLIYNFTISSIRGYISSKIQKRIHKI